MDRVKCPYCGMGIKGEKFLMRHVIAKHLPDKNLVKSKSTSKS